MEKLNKMTAEEHKSLEAAISYCIDYFSTQEATKRIIDYIKNDRDINEQLLQYNVIGQSEQLVCDCVKCKPFHNESAGYRQHKFCVKNKAN